jgi:aminoglycoside phosphotransferase (APT) family kinase protein
VTDDVYQGSQSDAPDAVEVRPGENLAWDVFEGYLRARLPELDGAFDVLQFPKGSANLTYLLRFGSQRLVLRRPPFGRLAPGAHSMAREYKTLSRLWREFPPSPRALLFCDDPEIIGSEFFVMEYREGVGIWDSIPASMQGHADVGRRVGFAVIDALAQLHSVDPDACELADLGRPEGFVARQVSGWRKRWELVAPQTGLAVMEHVGETLSRSLPAAQRVVVLHNDLKLDNCQFDPEVPDRVKSVFDWDMATLGDPLVDLGILLNYFPDPSDDGEDRGMYIDGMEYMGLPSHGELISRYSDKTGLDVSNVGWYLAFAAWKTAVVRQQLYDRYLRGESSDPRMAVRGQRVVELGQRAQRLLEQR